MTFILDLFRVLEYVAAANRDMPPDEGGRTARMARFKERLALPCHHKKVWTTRFSRCKGFRHGTVSDQPHIARRGGARADRRDSVAGAVRQPAGVRPPGLPGVLVCRRGDHVLEVLQKGFKRKRSWQAWKVRGQSLSSLSAGPRVRAWIDHNLATLAAWRRRTGDFGHFGSSGRGGHGKRWTLRIRAFARLEDPGTDCPRFPHPPLCLIFPGVSVVGDSSRV